MPEVNAAKVTPPISEYSSYSRYRSYYHVFVDGELRAHIGLPNGFGKDWVLLTLGGDERSKVGKKGKGRRGHYGVEDPITHLTGRLIEIGVDEFPTQAETDARNAAREAEATEQELAHKMRMAKHVEEGAQLMIALLRLAQRLPAEDAATIRLAANHLAYPPSSLKRALEIYNAEQANA